METIWQDARHAARRLARTPGFTLAVVVTLALGIAANTTLYGVMDALFLRPFPVVDTERVVAVWESHPQQGLRDAPGKWSGDQNPLAVADYLDLQRERPAIESAAAYRFRNFIVTNAGEPERVPGYLVTPEFFPTLGVRAAQGRLFFPEEGVAGSDTVVVLSHGFWQRRFGGEASILGRNFNLNGRGYTVVGVLPKALNFPLGGPEVFVPLVFTEAERQDRAKLSVYALVRLREGGGAPTTQSALDTFAARLGQQFPDSNRGRTLFLRPLRDMETGILTPFLLLFQGAALFVLLIACANVAGLVVAQGVGREQELALRAAVGAGRGRLVRQLLTENFLLALAGAGVAVWLAQSAVDFIRTSLPADHVRWFPGWSEIRLDGRALGFTIALTALTTLAFGLLPALRAARVNVMATLRAGGRGASGPPRQRLRGALVSLQVTLALVLLAGSALMTRGFFELLNLYQGFDPERVVTLRLQLPEWQYAEAEDISGFYQRVLEGVEKTPGVEAAGVVSQPPADLGPIPRASFLIEGQALERPEEKPSADLQTISPGYLHSLRIELRRGRALSNSDTADAPAVAVVSESLAERYWPGEEALGRRIRIGEGPWRAVVGVAADVKQYWFDREPRPTIYVPYQQSPRREMFMVVRSSLDTAGVVAATRARIHEADPNQPVDEIRTMATVVAESVSFIRLAAILMAVFGLVAVVLAAVGLYGVIAEHVARRTHEIGIRMALGARDTDILRLAVGQAGRLVAIGLVLGLAGAIALGQVAADALFGVVQSEPALLAAVTALLAAVALMAAALPAWRAVRVNPLDALREE